MAVERNKFPLGIKKSNIWSLRIRVRICYFRELQRCICQIENLLLKYATLYIFYQPKCHETKALKYWDKDIKRPGFSDLTCHLKDSRNRCFLVPLCPLILRKPNLEEATKKLLHLEVKIPLFPLVWICGYF